MSSNLSTRRTRVHEESCTEPVVSRISGACSLVFALSSDNDPFALTIPCEIIDPGAKWSDRKFEAVL